MDWMKKISITLCTLLFTLSAQAGEVSLGLNMGFVNNDLQDMDSLITAANTSATGPISTKALGNGYELVGILGYRFDSSIWALHLAPSFYFNTTDGTDANGDAFDYSITGFIAMPLLRIYAMENDVMSLFFQGGVGWGGISGEIYEADDKTDFSGSNLGYQAGLGLSVCYANMHCLNVEANLRVLNVERNIVDSTTSSGTHSGSTSPITQSSAGNELEIADKDLGVSLTGTQVLVGYVFKF
jgi:hypothetical protein